MKKKFELKQNYPNPFNPITHIEFEIANSGFVTLEIFNVLGKKVKTITEGNKAKGNYEVEFDGKNYPSGIYIYRLYLNKSLINSKKMLLLK